MSIVGSVTVEDYRREMRDYWRQVAESEGFDMENVTARPYFSSGVGQYGFDTYYSYAWNNTRLIYPYAYLVKLYAKVGLHRYNMLQNTSFNLRYIKKFNMLINCVSSYFITLVAEDSEELPIQPIRLPIQPIRRDSPVSWDLPSGRAMDGLEKTFQVRVDEEEIGVLNITCSVARPDDEVETIKKPFIAHFHGRAAPEDPVFMGDLPDWPHVPTTGYLFYRLPKSKWKFNDWIPTYLKAVVYADNRRIDYKNIMPSLEILSVWIEAEDREPAKSPCLHAYISFKGLPRNSQPAHVVHMAIIRRVLNRDTGYLTLQGKLTRPTHSMTLRSSHLP